MDIGSECYLRDWTEGVRTSRRTSYAWRSIAAKKKRIIIPVVNRKGYMKEYREKQKQLVSSAGSKANGKSNSKYDVNSLDKIREEGDKRRLTVTNVTVCRTKDVRLNVVCIDRMT